MKVKYIGVSYSKGKMMRVMLLIVVLVASYITLQYFEASETFANKVEFASRTKNKTYILGGEACGIKLLSTGVLVVEKDNPNIDLKIGDVILQVDNKSIDTNNELMEYINRSDVAKKRQIELTVKRDEKTVKITAKPIQNKDTKKYELGLWVKDSSAGVGMVTFYEVQNKKFAALGHGITETSKNIILPIQSGAIVKSRITSINKGFPNKPGDLRGTIYKEVYGQIRKNTVSGIYGTLENDALIERKSETIKLASRSEVKEGKAKIYCTLEDNEVSSYDIEIVSVMYNSSGNKNMIIKVTDDDLLKKTGGIIQGMSGSPIVQDGKLIGAITHVFLNNPAKGYAVFIENMVEDMEVIEE